MPYAIILIGAVLLVSGIRGTYADLWNLVRGDFTGTDSFLAWVAAIAVIGGIGYIPKLKPLSIALLTLLLLVLVISRQKSGGVFEKLQNYINSGLPQSSTSGGTNLSLNTVTDGAKTALADIGPAAEIAANLAAFA